MIQTRSEAARPDSLGVPGAGAGLQPAVEQEAGFPPEPERSSTRQRILDVALQLFVEQGYDGTSLREIAEKLGVTKAALYYHFESKEDILLALHMRLHEFGKDALVRMSSERVTLDLWSELLDILVDQMLAQRLIFLMHQRNETAIEKLHDKAHTADHEDIQNRLRLVLGDPSLPLRDRVRMAASVGVLFSGLLLSGEAFAGSSNRQLGQLLRDVLRDVLDGRPAGAART
jgi:AcrR family transcriptional regulator